MITTYKNWIRVHCWKMTKNVNIKIAFTLISVAFCVVNGFSLLQPNATSSIVSTKVDFFFLFIIICEFQAWSDHIVSILWGREKNFRRTHAYSCWHSFSFHAASFFWWGVRGGTLHFFKNTIKCDDLGIFLKSKKTFQ